MHRRAFLRGSAGALLSLPFLEAFGVQEAAANTGPKRLVIWPQCLSIYAQEFWPTPPGGTPYDRQTMPIEKRYKTGSTFLDNPDFTLPPALASLAPFQDQLLILEGLQNSTGNHKAYSTILTGTGGVDSSPASMKSIDQIIADEIGQASRYPSLQIGVRNHGADDKKAVSWRSKAQSNPATDSPIALWSRLFADLETDPEAAQKLLAQNRSVLDGALEQAASLQRTLGRADQEKVEQYLTAYRDLEQRLSMAPSCAPPPEPIDQSPSQPDRPLIHPSKGTIFGEDVPHVMDLQLDMLALSLACGLTNVATFQWGSEANNDSFPWIDNPIRWHDASHFTNHDPADWPGQVEEADGWFRVTRYTMENLARLAGQLDAFGILDDTLILFLVSMDHGGHHSGRNCPVFLMGGGGQFRTGRHLRLPMDNPSDYRTYNDLFLTIAQSMGVPLTTIGDDDMVNGPITEVLS